MRFVLALLVLAVTVYGVVDCARAQDHERKSVPLWAWVALMVILPGIGAVIWLVVSRLTSPGAGPVERRPLAPDDDPDFLRELDRRSRTGRQPNEPGDGTPADDTPADDGPTDSGGDRRTDDVA